MAPRKKSSISIDRAHESSLPSAIGATALANALHYDDESQEPEIRDIGRKTREQIAIQTGHVVKANVALHLRQKLYQSTDANFARYADGQRSVMDAERGAQEAADVEVFCLASRQDYADGIRALRRGVEDVLSEIVLQSIAPDAKVRSNEVVVEVKSLFGRSKVFRIEK